MLGAIFGDFVGSKYEFNNIKTTEFELIADDMSITDDSILTIAVADWLLQGELSKARLVGIFKDYVRRYPHPMGGYGGSFSSWAKSDESEPYGSWGNGSAMRVAAVGWAFDTLERTEEVAALTAEITHNHPEGIKGAQAVASAIFMARNGSTKRAIRQYITDKYGYNLSRSCDEIRPSYTFNESCAETVPEAIIAFLDSDDFESAIRLAISLGGDSDTLAAITGGIAEAFYGMDNTLPINETINSYGIIYRFIDRIPEDLRVVLEMFDKEFYPRAKKFMAKNEARASRTKIEWKKQKCTDYALTPKQYAVFMKSYQPDWDCRYSVHYDDGFHYITRSFLMIKKFRYELMEDGLYHIKEHYANSQDPKGHSLEDVFFHGYFPSGTFANIRYNIVKKWRFKELKTDLDKATFIAELAYRPQSYICNMNYFDHYMRVMKMRKNDNYKILAVLKDLIELSSWTFEMLEIEGFSEEVIDALRCLTKKSKDEPNEEFIERVATNPLAVKVMLNTLKDKMDITRLKEINDKDVENLRNQLKMYRYLKSLKAKK